MNSFIFHTRNAFLFILICFAVPSTHAASSQPQHPLPQVVEAFSHVESDPSVLPKRRVRKRARPFLKLTDQESKFLLLQSLGKGSLIGSLYLSAFLTLLPVSMLLLLLGIIVGLAGGLYLLFGAAPKAMGIPKGKRQTFNLLQFMGLIGIGTAFILFALTIPAYAITLIPALIFFSGFSLIFLWRRRKQFRKSSLLHGE